LKVQEAGGLTVSVSGHDAEAEDVVAVPLYSVDERGPTTAEPEVFGATYPTLLT
jgi:hypothetical protein